MCWYSGLRRLGAERAGLACLIPLSAAVGSALTGATAPTLGKSLGAVLVGLGVAGGLALTGRVDGA